MAEPASLLRVYDPEDTAAPTSMQSDYHLRAGKYALCSCYGGKFHVLRIFQDRQEYEQWQSTHTPVEPQYVEWCPPLIKQENRFDRTHTPRKPA